MTDAASSKTPRRWFVSLDRSYLASYRAGELELATTAHLPLLTVSGALADELAELWLGTGRPSAGVAARLAALRAGISSERGALLGRFGEVRFVPAAPGDVLAADGFGQLWIELSSRCNERCVHCYAESGPERDDSLEREMVLAALRDARELGFDFVQFTGGEPLLCPFLLEAVREACRLELGVEVFTNGLVLDPERLASLTELGVSFAFSLYGASAEVHERVTRTAGSFETTMNAIRRVREAGARFRIGVIVSDENRAHAPATLALARTLVTYPEAARMSAVRTVGRGRTTPENLELERKQWTEAELTLPAPDHRQGRAVLCADGRLRPCIFTRWISLGRVGTDGSLAELLRSPKVTIERDLESNSEQWASERLACGICRRTAVCLEELSYGLPEG